MFLFVDKAVIMFMLWHSLTYIVNMFLTTDIEPKAVTEISFCFLIVITNITQTVIHAYYFSNPVKNWEL